MAIEGANLTIGGKRFEMRTGVEVRPRVRTGYLLDNEGQITMQILDQLFGALPGFDGFEQRRGLHLDLGGGEHVIQIEFTGWQGSDQQFGNATNADPATQMDELITTVANTQIDSFRPATLEYGEHYPGGRYASVPVALEGPETVRTSNPNEVMTFDGSLVAVATATFDQDVFMSALQQL